MGFRRLLFPLGEGGTGRAPFFEAMAPAATPPAQTAAEGKRRVVAGGGGDGGGGGAKRRAPHTPWKSAAGGRGGRSLAAATPLAQTAAKGKLRFVAVEMVHGAAGSTNYGLQHNLWSPAAVGRGFDLSPTALAPIDPLREYVTIVSNTDVRMAEEFTTPEI